MLFRSRSWVASTASAAAFAMFSSAAKAGLIASWNDVCDAAGKIDGADVESKCADCNGTPAISATNTSALREGIAACIAAGTLDVAGHAGNVGFAAKAACKLPMTVKTLARSWFASMTPAAPAE